MFNRPVPVKIFASQLQGGKTNTQLKRNKNLTFTVYLQNIITESCLIVLRLVWWIVTFAK